MTLPRSIQLMLTALSGLTGLSALVVAALALLQRPSPAWFLAWFELVVVAAGIFGVLVGRGRFREGPAITLLCIAGVVAVGTLLGYLSAGRELMGVSLTGLLLARAAGAAVFAAAAGADVLLREPRRSVPMLCKGIAAGVPVMIVLVLAARGSMLSQVSGWHPLAQVAFWLLGFAVFAALACASAHWVIRSFQIGVELAEARRTGSPEPASTGASR